MAEEKCSLNSTTRTFKTVYGDKTYAELSDMVAPKLVKLLDDITNGFYIKEPINEQLVKEFHYRIIGSILPDIAGKWRTVPVQVGNHIPPEAFEVPILMREYVENLSARIENANSIQLQMEALAFAEGEFLHIHPFQDFNGRTIRALLRELLVRLDLPLVDTYVERDTPRFKKYQNSLAEYDNGRLEQLKDFWIDRFESGIIIPPSIN